MTTKRLRPSVAPHPDIRVTEVGEVAIASGLSATIEVPPGYPNFVCALQNISAETTAQLKMLKEGYVFDLSEDLDNNTYPRATYQGGDRLAFVANFPGGYGVVASFGSAITGTLVLEAYK